MPRFPSHVAVSDADKTKLIETANTLLATTLDLASQVKQAHWNIKGSQFFARHELFDKLAAKLYALSDDIAERAATLGGYANGTLRLAAAASQIPEYDLDAVDGRRHIQALVKQYEGYTKLCRRAVEEAGAMSEPATEDLYIEVLRSAELDMWFLESHLNGE